MKKIFLIVLFLTTYSLSLSAQPASPMGRQDSGFTNKAEAKNQMVAGKKEGKWLEYLDTLKKPASENNASYYSLTVYKADKAEGIKRYYTKLGVLLGVYPFVDGKKNGTVKEYYSSGKLSALFPFLDGKLEGVVKTYYENGKLKSEETDKNDKLNGSYKEYYENGNLKEEGNFVDDEKNGTYKLYNENGKLVTETQYNKGDEGETTNYNADGSEVKPIIWEK
jgi:antitoxin component YwqK of YwqJK toxin-antitoxin module